MPFLKTYDLFISHAWKYGTEYDNLVSLLNSAPYFSYRNYSAPEDKPLVSPGSAVTNAILRKHIDNKIRPVNAVLVLSGMYYYYHDWMKVEMDIAQSYHKPIIAIKPRGNQFVPQEISCISNTVVNWNTASIVSAIRDYSI